MNIDIYIQLFKDHCNNLDHEEMDGIAEWLEELKELRELKETYAKGMETSYSEFRYKQGRADAEKEYLLNTYGLTVKIAEAEKQRIRTEAIDECIELIEHGCFISGTAGNCLRRHMEQLKESKE